jgi:PAS domain S-box-containing protein
MALNITGVWDMEIPSPLRKITSCSASQACLFCTWFGCFGPLPKRPASPFSPPPFHNRKMIKPKVVPLLQEREFHLHELFFSTTDKKGLIRAGNDVFARVSGYELTAMIGQPHNLVRHPDMPRAVFKLLWDYLKADKSIVAYVKNLASDGRHYWVVALVTPSSEGYLSIRFKPSSELFPVARGLYHDLVTLENNLIGAGKPSKDAMQLAGDWLLAALQAKGFASYDNFMHLMLREELKSREQLLHQRGAADPPAPPRRRVTAPPADESAKRLLHLTAQSEKIAQTLTQLFSKLDDFVLLGGKLEGKVVFISGLAQSMRILSLNTGIASSHLAVEREVLTSIANLMGDNSKSLNANVQAMGEHLLTVSAFLKSIVYDLAGVRLQLEMLQTFLGELLHRCHPTEPTKAANSRLLPCILTLQNTFVQTYKQAVTSFERIEGDLQSLRREGTGLQRAVQTLQFVHLVGRVEISRSTQLAGLGKIMEDVLGKIQNMRELLADLTEAVAYLFREVYGVGEIDRRVATSLQLMQADAQALKAAAALL